MAPSDIDDEFEIVETSISSIANGVAPLPPTTQPCYPTEFNSCFRNPPATFDPRNYITPAHMSALRGGEELVHVSQCKTCTEHDSCVVVNHASGKIEHLRDHIQYNPEWARHGPVRIARYLERVVPGEVRSSRRRECEREHTHAQVRARVRRTIADELLEKTRATASRAVRGGVRSVISGASTIPRLVRQHALNTKYVRATTTNTTAIASENGAQTTRGRKAETGPDNHGENTGSEQTARSAYNDQDQFGRSDSRSEAFRHLLHHYPGLARVNDPIEFSDPVSDDEEDDEDEDESEGGQDYCNMTAGQILKRPASLDSMYRGFSVVSCAEARLAGEEHSAMGSAIKGGEKDQGEGSSWMGEGDTTRELLL
ncbi:hypothetical protein BP5796_04059 [Coleophoma crateriformis]|uniref:Uncharacterized protein n=1 Tax=Coleophoma crateriformis TaxID=565419 RepID=A0A3D8SHU4_9HELO|nr:hypothetical protein BP5796_04059 [Coleophoma crateriformis]